MPSSATRNEAGEGFLLLFFSLGNASRFGVVKSPIMQFLHFLPGPKIDSPVTRLWTLTCLRRRAARILVCHACFQNIGLNWN